jgi:hypothetical protein
LFSAQDLVGEKPEKHKKNKSAIFMRKSGLFPLQINNCSAIIPNRHILALRKAAPKVREEVKE